MGAQQQNASAEQDMMMQELNALDEKLTTYKGKSSTVGSKLTGAPVVKEISGSRRMGGLMANPTLGGSQGGGPVGKINSFATT